MRKSNYKDPYMSESDNMILVEIGKMVPVSRINILMYCYTHHDIKGACRAVKDLPNKRHILAKLFPNDFFVREERAK